MNERALILDTEDSLAMRMADDALAEAGISRFIVEFTKSGMSMEMPCAPSLGRGTRWQIAVLKEHQAQAEEVLSGLPMELSASPNLLKDLPAPPKAKRWLAWYRALCAAGIAGLALAFYFLSR